LGFALPENANLLEITAAEINMPPNFVPEIDTLQVKDY